MMINLKQAQKLTNLLSIIIFEKQCANAIKIIDNLYKPDI